MFQAVKHLSYFILPVLLLQSVNIDFLLSSLFAPYLEEAEILSIVKGFQFYFQMSVFSAYKVKKETCRNVLIVEMGI